MIARRLASIDFDVLLHPAAMTSPDAGEDDPELAGRVNAEAPGVLAAECRRRGARMIHISTDYVFGGRAPGMRDEDDAAIRLSVYGTDASWPASGRCWADRGPACCGCAGSIGPGAGLSRAGDRAGPGGRRLWGVADKFSLPTFAPDLVDWIGAVRAPEVPRRGARVPLGRAGQLALGWRPSRRLLQAGRSCADAGDAGTGARWNAAFRAARRATRRWRLAAGGAAWAAATGLAGGECGSTLAEAPDIRR